MKFAVNAPPKLTGRQKNDISLLNNWCSVLHRKLCGMFRAVEDNQIMSVSGNKVSGDIELDRCSVKGSGVNISSDYFLSPRSLMINFMGVPAKPNAALI